MVFPTEQGSPFRQFAESEQSHLQAAHMTNNQGTHDAQQTASNHEGVPSSSERDTAERKLAFKDIFESLRAAAPLLPSSHFIYETTEILEPNWQRLSGSPSFGMFEGPLLTKCHDDGRGTKITWQSVFGPFHGRFQTVTTLVATITRFGGNVEDVDEDIDMETAISTIQQREAQQVKLTALTENPAFQNVPNIKVVVNAVVRSDQTIRAARRAAEQVARDAHPDITMLSLVKAQQTKRKRQKKKETCKERRRKEEEARAANDDNEIQIGPPHIPTDREEEKLAQLRLKRQQRNRELTARRKVKKLEKNINKLGQGLSAIGLSENDNFGGGPKQENDRGRQRQRGLPVARGTSDVAPRSSGQVAVDNAGNNSIVAAMEKETEDISHALQNMRGLGYSFTGGNRELEVAGEVSSVHPGNHASVPFTGEGVVATSAGIQTVHDSGTHFGHMVLAFRNK